VRQGVKVGAVRHVLIISMILAVVAFVLVATFS